MEYEQGKKKKPGGEEFKQDVTEAIKNSKPKRRRKKATKGKIGKKSKAGKYDTLSAKEMYQMVKQKRDMILSKKGIPAKLPRGKSALIDICKKIKL